MVEFIAKNDIPEWEGQYLCLENSVGDMNIVYVDEVTDNHVNLRGIFFDELLPLADYNVTWRLWYGTICIPTPMDRAGVAWEW